MSRNPDNGKLLVGIDDSDALITRWVGWKSQRLITIHNATDEKIRAAVAWLDTLAVAFATSAEPDVANAKHWYESEGWVYHARNCTAYSDLSCDCGLDAHLAAQPDGDEPIKDGESWQEVAVRLRTDLATVTAERDGLKIELDAMTEECEEAEHELQGSGSKYHAMESKYASTIEDLRAELSAEREAHAGTWRRADELANALGNVYQYYEYVATSHSEQGDSLLKNARYALDAHDARRKADSDGGAK